MTKLTEQLEQAMLKDNTMMEQIEKVEFYCRKNNIDLSNLK